MTDRQRHPWRPVTLLWLLATQLPPASLQSCDKFSYSVEGKCCSYCKPGFEMESRCTSNRDTGCRPCLEGLFNEGFSNEFCQPCTQCNVGSGSRVLKNCTRSSDTVCQCTPGTQPAQFFKWGVECTPCPPGHFSLGENTMCKPWTNCVAIGRRTQRPGSSRADAGCEEARTSGPHPSPPTPTRTPAASSPPTVPLRLTTQSLGVLSTLTPQPDKPWSSFSIIFLVLFLLLVFGLIMLILGIYLSRKDKRQLPTIWKPSGPYNFRMPIQEEHQYSLAKV
ncbi:tumor necrosis factor receptor superfamily member 4 [Antechinus flavipes]|uniref:tumor necrosis factor receptor superfamily member 4 n=1 Tax=Antechinus flavipes TaxID=38775 RepID=UPI002235C9B4|nr:tumor necrosis factor receptor superfamily member 4 [Antechinus flavipes]